jgi:uncharacterized protein (DUF697 family)
VGIIGSVGGALRAARPVAGALKEVDELAEGGGRIHVLPGDPASERRVRELLGGDVSAPDESALAIMPVRADSDLSRGTPALVARRHQGGEALALVIGDAEERADLERRLLRGHRLEMSNIAHVPSLEGDEGAAALAEAIRPRLGDDAVAAGWRYPGLRAAIARDMVQRRARQAAALGAVPLPGVDMPALSLIQIRLISELGALYGRRFSPERVIEALGILAAGFGWRAVARSAVGVVPGAGWAVRGGIAYTATRAMGEAALGRLESGHGVVEGLPLDRVRPIFDRVADRLGLVTPPT